MKRVLNMKTLERGLRKWLSCLKGKKSNKSIPLKSSVTSFMTRQSGCLPSMRLPARKGRSCRRRRTSTSRESLINWSRRTSRWRRPLELLRELSMKSCQIWAICWTDQLCRATSFLNTTTLARSSSKSRLNTARLRKLTQSFKKEIMSWVSKLKLSKPADRSTSPPLKTALPILKNSSVPQPTLLQLATVTVLALHSHKSWTTLRLRSSKKSRQPSRINLNQLLCQVTVPSLSALLSTVTHLPPLIDNSLRATHLWEGTDASRASKTTKKTALRDSYNFRTGPIWGLICDKVKK